jgi:hypothetical protein
VVIAANEPGYATFRARLPSLRSKCAEVARENQSKISALLSAEDALERSGSAPQRIAGVS